MGVVDEVASEDVVIALFCPGPPVANDTAEDIERIEEVSIVLVEGSRLVFAASAPAPADEVTGTLLVAMAPEDVAESSTDETKLELVVRTSEVVVGSTLLLVAESVAEVIATTTVVVASVLSDEVNVIGVIVAGKMRVPGSAEAAANVDVELDTSIELD